MDTRIAMSCSQFCHFPTAQRLLQNQLDLGNAIKPFYGDAAGGQLTALLKDHIIGAVNILTAAKADYNARVQTASTEWYANGNDIATFPNRANPQNIPLDQIQSDMKMHLDLTLNEAVDHLKGNYPASVADYDKVHEEILGMADMLSTGIINQSPAMFGGTSPVGMPRTGNSQSAFSYNWLMLVIASLAVASGWLLRKRSSAS
jgi:LPXTG-motif cell wall-anchored protein